MRSNILRYYNNNNINWVEYQSDAGVFCKKLWKKSPRYNGIAVYLQFGQNKTQWNHMFMRYTGHFTIVDEILGQNELSMNS